MDNDIFPELGDPDMDETWTPPRNISQGTFIIYVFLVVVAVGLVAGLSAFGLARLAPSTAAPDPGLQLPWAFAISTVLLIVSSFAQHRGIGYVRLEKQRPFRKWLMIAVVIGTLFLALQSYGLWCLMASEVTTDTQTGVNAFVFVLAFLHALHVGVAMMVLVFVTLRGLTDRYDHEYFWGVIVCAFFWDALGLIWLFILAIFAIAI